MRPPLGWWSQDRQLSRTRRQRRQLRGTLRSQDLVSLHEPIHTLAARS